MRAFLTLNVLPIGTVSDVNKLFLIRSNSKGTVSKVWIPFDYVEKHSPVNNEVWRRMRLNG